jgi:CRP-like cAMP-binding protein
LLSDLDTRQQDSSPVQADLLVMPLTQEMLGDALGLSALHVNRVLHQLRREQIIRTHLGRIEIVNRHLLGRAMLPGR